MITVLVTYFLVRKFPDTYKSHARISTGIVDQSSQLLLTNDVSQESRIAQQFSNILEVFHLKTVFDQVSFQLILHDLTSSKPFRSPSKLVKEIGPNARAHAIEVFSERLKSKAPLSLWDRDQNGLNQLLISMGYDEQTLQKSIYLYRVNNSDFIDVEMESENPFLSAFIVNALCKEFLEYYSNYIRSNQLRAVNFLDTLMKVKYDSMNNKMRQLRDYKIRNRILNLNEQAKSLYTQITDYETRLQMANKDVSSFESAINGIDKKFDPRDRRYLESTIVAVNQAIIETRNQLQIVTEDLIRNNYDSRIKAKQDSLRSLLEQQILQSTDKLLVSPLSNKQTLVTQRINLEVSRDLSLGSISSINQEIERLNRKFDLLVPHEALIQNYEGAVDVAGKEYLEVLNKFNKTTYETSLGMQLHQIEMAMPGPALPSKKLLLVIISGIVSFVFCFVALFVVFYLDHSIINALDLANQTGIPVLSFLPSINTSLLDLSSLSRGEETSRNTIAFKHLLRSLRFEVERAMSTQKMLVVTSLHNGEGKSLISLGLAYALSMVNKKVLLIDGNFDEPTITHISNTNFFLEDYLKNNISIADVLREGKVSIMGNKGGDASLFELCDETIVKPKFTYLRDVFDVIIVEAPSLDRMNKSREWIVIADKVLGVYASGRTIKPNAKPNVDYIHSIGNRFAGWVLNKVHYNRLESLPK
jgi:Mrp family chromosome partitioning ATPase/capsular polysaccharide biosynthesis protein